MALIFQLCVFLSISVLFTSGLASSQVHDWESVTATLRSTLDILTFSHEQYLAQEKARPSKRDATFRTGPAGYWRPLGAGHRLDASEDFSEELNNLISEIGDAVQQLIALLVSQFNIEGLVPSATAASTATASPDRPLILPITNIHLYPTTSAMPVSHATATTSRSLVPDRPLTTSIRASPSATYTFNPQATDLNVAYYSQTDLTPVISLTQVCSDPNVDIVILAFITRLVANGGYPSMNMASNCWAPNEAQQAAGATGLLDCVGDGLASKIAHCQQQGKKVMLSVGGAFGDLTLSSDAQAVQAANTLWNLFLGGTDSNTMPLRPYGSVVLDGIDIDNESPSGATYLPVIARTLRQLMSSSNRAYYLSAAPQCPRPDASIPIAALLPYIDFFSVQFYNNPSCNLNAGADFLSSLQSWSSDLIALQSLIAGSKSRVKGRIPNPSITSGFMAINNGITSPRLLIGTPAFPAAGSGYVDVATYKGILEQVRALGLPNLAGAMFWDGAYLERSAVLVDGVLTTFTKVVKDVL